MKRIPALDGIRALAIIMVVACHAQVFLKVLSGPLAYFCVGMAWSGVYLFFVLSGYLVGNLALSELGATGRIRVIAFWGRRALRTWPMYFLALFGNYLVLPPLGGAERVPALYRYMTFTQIFSPMNYFIESWTLCIEEQFYLVLPLFFLAVVWLAGPKRIGLACLFLIGLSYVFRFRYGYRLSPGATFDSLFVGVLIARLDQSRNSTFEFVRRWPWPTLLAGIAVFCLAFALGGTARRQFQGMLSIGFGLMLVSALHPASLWAKFLGARIFKVIALSSYSAYLTHVFTIRCLGHLGFAPTQPSKWFAGVVFVSACGITFIIGWLVYRFIEKPGLRLREVIVPRRGSAQPMAAAASAPAAP